MHNKTYDDGLNRQEPSKHRRSWEGLVYGLGVLGFMSAPTLIPGINIELVALVSSMIAYVAFCALCLWGAWHSWHRSSVYRRMRSKRIRK